MVDVGDTVRITIINNDTINHNWGADVLSPAAFNATTPTIGGLGNTTRVEFVAGIPGVFKYYRNVGRHRQLELEDNLVVNAIAPPPSDVSSRVKALEDQVSTLLSLTNQVRGIDDQIKSLSSSVTNLVAEQSTLKTSLSSMTNFASEQTALKAAMDSASSQGALLMGLSGIATLLGIIALGIAVTAARKKSS